MKDKILTLLLSLAISFGLWLYVVTVISPESEITIDHVPVELVGTGTLDMNNLIIVSPTENLRVNLTLGGERSDLNKLNRSNVTVILDVAKITKAGEYQMDYSVSYQSGTADVLEKTPNRITVQVAEKRTKNVSVEYKFIGAVPSGYEADISVAMDPTTVTVSGPKETIDKIAYAQITVDLTGKMTTFAEDYPLTLCGIDRISIADDSYVTVNLEEIRAVVQVYQMKRVPLVIVEDYLNSGLQEGTVTVHKSVENVTLIGNSESLAKTEDTLPFTVSMRDFDESTTIVLTPELPDGVHCKEKIEIHIIMPEMASKVFTVNAEGFDTINVAEGLTVRVTEAFEVTVRGPKEELEQLTAADIVGTVDCANVTANSGYAPVEYSVRGYDYLYVRGAWENVFIQVTPAEAE